MVKSKALSEVTPFVRQILRLWIAERRNTTFTSLEAVDALVTDYPVLMNLESPLKAISNELIRLESVGLISSRKASKEEVGECIGRRPKLYSKKFCKESLTVIKDVLI